MAKRVHGVAIGEATSDHIITVIDLSAFKIVNSRRTKNLDLLEFQDVEMDREGRIFVDSISSWKKAEGAFIPLDIPSLRAGARCAYKLLPVKPGEPERPVPVTAENCAEDIGSVSIGDYLKARPFHRAGSPLFTCKSTAAEYCPHPDRFTPDKRFGLGVRTEGHDGLLGSWVQTHATGIVFSTSRRAEIGELDLTHNAPVLALASVNGCDYLFVLRSGAELTVYQLIDSDQG